MNTVKVSQSHSPWGGGLRCVTAAWIRAERGLSSAALWLAHPHTHTSKDLDSFVALLDFSHCTCRHPALLYYCMCHHFSNVTYSYLLFQMFVFVQTGGPVWVWALAFIHNTVLCFHKRTFLSFNMFSIGLPEAAHSPHVIASWDRRPELSCWENSCFRANLLWTWAS